MWNRQHKHISSSQAHLALRYVPSIIGSITTIWWRAIISTLGRFTPYISMAANRGTPDDHRTKGNIAERALQTNYGSYGVELSFNTIHNRHQLLHFGQVIQVVVHLFLVSLKAAFVQIRPGDRGWELLVSSKIGFCLISIYALLTLYTLVILARLWNRETGLKWDPKSLMDQLALVQGSNIWPIFHGLETCGRKHFPKLLEKRISKFGSIRLGYWKSRSKGSIWHGIRLLPKSKGTLCSLVFRI